MIYFDDTCLNSQITDQVKFERNSVKILAKCWFSDIPFSNIEKAYAREMGKGTLITYDWFSSHIGGEVVPNITFGKIDAAWKVTIHDLFTKRNNALVDIFTAWQEQPSDCFVFPVVGKKGIVIDTLLLPDDFTTQSGVYIVGSGDSPFCLTTLETFAENAIWNGLEFNLPLEEE